MLAPEQSRIYLRVCIDQQVLLVRIVIHVNKHIVSNYSNKHVNQHIVKKHHVNFIM